jgi:RNA polymerase sigma factor (sigma-70 family)
VNDQTDSQLLGAWAETRSEPAFAELVRRHVDFVYSAALRMVCDSHLAKDVTQSVFVALAKEAGRITDRRVLSDWLHRTAQNVAAQTVRTDVRRRAREQEAAVMNELLSTEPDASWEHIAPQLDAALSALSEPDRHAILLRYFENKSLREVGQASG